MSPLSGLFLEDGNVITKEGPPASVFRLHSLSSFRLVFTLVFTFSLHGRKAKAIVGVFAAEAASAEQEREIRESKQKIEG